jgi:uncharacterized Zn-finger protein
MKRFLPLATTMKTRRIVEFEKVVNTNTLMLKNLSEVRTNETIQTQSYNCKVCDKSFSSSKDLKAHTKVEHQKKKCCMYCQKTFEKTYELEKHLEMHKGKEFECRTCGKGF